MNSTINFSEILASAVNEPGKISVCYSAFHDYSIGNQFAAMFVMVCEFEVRRQSKSTKVK
jgi:hypothetical protein